MTNGEKIKATFPHYDIEIDELKGYVRIFYENFYTTYPWDWWNSEYKEPTTKNDLGVDCISRAEVIEEINSVANYAWDEEQMRVDLIAEINALPSVTPQEPRWIPINERLPDEGYSVLVMRITDDNYKYMRVATYQGDCWMDDTDKFNKPNPHKVIAWMPLPKPYESQEVRIRNELV